MPTYRNGDVHTRVWPTLTNPETGRTLELAPGATVDADYGADFTDQYLHEVAPPRKPKPSPEPQSEE